MIKKRLSRSKYYSTISVLINLLKSALFYVVKVNIKFYFLRFIFALASAFGSSSVVPSFSQVVDFLIKSQ